MKKRDHVLIKRINRQVHIDRSTDDFLEEVIYLTRNHDITEEVCDHPDTCYVHHGPIRTLTFAEGIQRRPKLYEEMLSDALKGQKIQVIKTEDYQPGKEGIFVLVNEKQEIENVYLNF